MIDSKLDWTPSRPKNGDLNYPDHYALRLDLKNIPMMDSDAPKDQKKTIWNTKKEKGWEQYKEATDDNVNLIRAAEMDIEDPDKIMKIIEKELTTIKHRCFGKIKISTKNHDKKVLENLQKKKAELCRRSSNTNSMEMTRIDLEMQEVMKRIQKKQFEKDVIHLEELKSGKGQSAANFHLKDTILGRKKSSQEKVVIVDPESGKDVVSPKQIKEVSLKYCVNLLKSKEPKSNYKNHVKQVKEKHLERMLEIVPNDIEELPFEAFCKAFEKINKKTGRQ